MLLDSLKNKLSNLLALRKSNRIYSSKGRFDLGYIDPSNTNTMFVVDSGWQQTPLNTKLTHNLHNPYMEAFFLDVYKVNYEDILNLIRQGEIITFAFTTLIPTDEQPDIFVADIKGIFLGDKELYRKCELLYNQPTPDSLKSFSLCSKNAAN